MEEELRSVVKVSAYTASLMTYSRLAASSTNPGLLRLLALLPALILLPSLPLHFKSIHLLAVSEFCLAWLALFKLLLLAFGSGPLSPALPLIPFIATASLPLKPRAASSVSNDNKHPLKPSNNNLIADLLIPSTLKLIAFSFLLSLYQFKPVLPRFVLYCCYNLHLYLSLDLVLTFLASLSGPLLGVDGLDLAPQCDAPLLSSSLQDFWGRRWNLMVSDILRPSVYNPVKSRYGEPAAVMAAFMVSGIMHEVLYSCYLPVVGPSRGEALFYFFLHGVCVMVEGKARRSPGWQYWWIRTVPLVVMRRVMTLGFVVVTSSYLLHQPLIRSGIDESLIQESKAIMGFFLRVLKAGIFWMGTTLMH